MQKQLNLKVKYRESFVHSLLAFFEDVNEWFEHETSSPYMLIVAKVKKDKCRTMTQEESSLFGIDKLNIARSSVPAITHVDYSARIQTVHADTNSSYYAVISKFKEKTGCPLVVNTSFNAWRAYCLFTQGCIQVFYGYRVRFIGYWKFFVT